MFTAYSPFSAMCAYAVPFMPNLLPSLRTFLNASYTRSPISMSLYVSFISNLPFKISNTLIFNVAVISSARLNFTKYSPPVASLFSHAKPLKPRPLLPKSFLMTSYTRSPTKRSAYNSLNFTFPSISSTTFTLYNGCTTSRRFISSTYCVLPATSFFASYANLPAKPRCNVLSKSFLVISNNTSPTRISENSPFTYSPGAFKSSATFMLRTTLTTSARFVLTTYLPFSTLA